MTVSTNCHGLRWELAAGFEPLLNAVLASSGEPVKNTFDTVVTRHQVAGRTFYCKHYHHGRRPLAAPVYLVRQPKSQREWRHAAKLTARRLAVVPHLAYGERWSWCGLLQTTLITEGQDGFVLLDAVPEPDAAAVQCALGKFLRQMHDAGVLYLDISDRNLLYSATADACCLLDVDKLAFRPQLTREERLTNLAYLHSFFALSDSFFHAYGGLAGSAAAVQTEAADLRQARLAKWADHCLAHQHEITIQHAGGVQWFVRREFFDEKLRQLMINPNQSGVTQLPRASGKAAYRAAYLAELSGASKIKPIAAADQRVCGFLVRGFLIVR